MTVPVARTRTRKDTTIYQCDECEQRYLAEQWCYDCNRPCTLSVNVSSTSPIAATWRAGF